MQGAINLAQEQLDAANGDDRTQLPDGLTRPARWVKGEKPESPAPQPDGDEQTPAAAGAPGSGK